MTHLLFDIWEVSDGSRYNWRVQMVNYVAHMPNKETAEKFVAAIRLFRESSQKAVK